MESPVAEVRSPLSPPPPVYLSSSPPPPPPPPQAEPPPVPPKESQNVPQRRQSQLPDPKKVPKRKPITVSTLDGMRGDPKMHNTCLSPVRIDNVSTIPQASSAQIENARSTPSPPTLPPLPPPHAQSQRAVSTADDNQQSLPPRGSSLTSGPQATDDQSPSPQYLPYRAKPAAGSEPNLVSSFPQRKQSLAAPEAQSPRSGPAVEPNDQDRSTGSSRSSVASVALENENHQPLQYHHQPFYDHLRGKGKRASRGTIMTRSDSSSTEQLPNGHHLVSGRTGRQASLGVPRPGSAYSDFVGRGRTQSPQLSPYLHGRTLSSHSLTGPDTRPLSFVDLGNVPYPQQQAPPAMLGNSHLRPSVGNNASLLSHKQTFEMYLANVKKTNDPGAQYEFAVFMIHSAKELGDEEPSNSDAIPKADLLREAKAILQGLAGRSYPYAQYYLGDGLASGLFNKGKPDLEKGFQLFVAASKHGHAEAGYRAALCYEFGWGSRQDGAKAVQFYRQAASKNHPGAMSRIGRACLAGDMGLTKRYREGITWLKRAAETADPQYNSAPYDLGVLHETGYGDDVFQDEAYAAQLFTKAAELGHPEASYRMGDAYEHGKLGCPRDPALSVHFYTGAAQQAHPLAMMALCAWFMVGAEPVLEKDETEAYEWAKRAAECGLAKAEYALAYFTEMGIGCRRDALEANMWYVKAADHGDERAKHRIAAIRAAAEGEDPNSVARRKLKPSGEKQNKGKRFGIF